VGLESLLNRWETAFRARFDTPPRRLAAAWVLIGWGLSVAISWLIWGDDGLGHTIGLPLLLVMVVSLIALPFLMVIALGGLLWEVLRSLLRLADAAVVWSVRQVRRWLASVERRSR
jgi:hypothetical protein